MNTSDLFNRQTELASQLQDQTFLHSIPLEQSNLLRREKETLDAYLQVAGQVQAANIPAPVQEFVREDLTVAEPQSETPDALGQDLDTAVHRPVRKAAVKKAPALKVVSKHKK